LEPQLGAVRRAKEDVEELLELMERKRTAETPS